MTTPAEKARAKLTWEDFDYWYDPISNQYRICQNRSDRENRRIVGHVINRADAETIVAFLNAGRTFSDPLRAAEAIGEAFNILHDFAYQVVDSKTLERAQDLMSRLQGGGE